MLLTLMHLQSQIPKIGEQHGSKGKVAALWSCGNWNKVIVQYDNGRVGLVGPCDTSMCGKYKEDLFLCVFSKIPTVEKEYQPVVYRLDGNEHRVGRVRTSFEEIKRMKGWLNFYLARDFDRKVYLILIH